jgi:hypothetical protein
MFMVKLGMTAGPYSQDLRAKAIDWTNMKRWIKQQTGAYLSLYDVIFSILCKTAIQLLLLYGRGALQLFDLFFLRDFGDKVDTLNGHKA